METFGYWLFFYRNSTKDYENGYKPLTQERLAGLIHYAPNTISSWETDSRVPPKRDTVIKIIKSLVEYQGITVPTEANRLLKVAGYGSLTEEEVQEFPPNWQPGSGESESSDSSSTTPETVNNIVNNTTINNTEFNNTVNNTNNTTVNNTEFNNTVNNTTVNNTEINNIVVPPQNAPPAKSNLLAFFEHFFYVEPKENTSQLSAVITHWLQLLKLPDILSANLIGFITLWAFYAWGWACFLQWPYINKTAAVISCVIFALCSFITPTLLGLSMGSDNQQEMEAALGGDTHIKFVRIVAITCMNLLVQTFIFLLVMILYAVGVWPIHYAVIAFLALVNILLMYTAGRAWPYRYFTWGYKRSENPSEMNLIKTFGFSIILIWLASSIVIPLVGYVNAEIVRETPQLIPALLAILISLVGIYVALKVNDPRRHLLAFFQAIMFLIASAASLWILVQGFNPFLAITCLLLTALFVLSLGEIANDDDTFFNLFMFLLILLISSFMQFSSVVFLIKFGQWGYLASILPFSVLYVLFVKRLATKFTFMIIGIILIWITTFALLTLKIPLVWKNSAYALLATALVVWQIWRNRRARRALAVAVPPPTDQLPADAPTA
ncbi:MAG: helix-turn-helix transcriptional regulator [Anaerolineae bacterium]